MNAPANTARKQGIFSGITSEQYHADRTSYSSSFIKMMTVPAAARHYLDTPQEYKECFRIGRAVHSWILEPDVFHSENLIAIDTGRRSKADKFEWIEWFESNGWSDAGEFVLSNSAATWNSEFEKATGKNLVTPEEKADLALMAESVAANPFSRELLEKGKPEQSVYWQDKETGLNLRVRPDFLNAFCSDLKSCQSAAPRDVSRDIFKLGYHISAAMYSDGLQQVTGEIHPFTFIFVEKKAPFLCAVYSLDEDSQAFADRQYRELLRTLAKCLDTDQWPGYTDNLELSLPYYALKSED